MNAEIKEPKKFDVEMEKAFISIALKDLSFAKKMVSYLKGVNRGPKNSTTEVDYTFSSVDCALLYKAIQNSVQEYQQIPSEGHIRDFLSKNYEDSQSLGAFKLYRDLMKMELQDEAYYRDSIEAFARAVIIVNAEIKAMESIDKDILSVSDIWKDALEEIKKVNFSKGNSSGLHQIYEVMDSEVEDLYLATGIAPLDNDLGGGLPYGGLCLIIAGVNSCKTTTCVDIASNALKNGKKVIHISLDSKRGDAAVKYMSNISDTKMRDFKSGKDNNALDKERIDKIYQKYHDQIQIYEWFDYGLEVLGLLSRIDDALSEFPADLVVIDYLTLLRHEDTMRRKWDSQKEVIEVVRAISAFAKDKGIVIISPAQANREGQKRVNGTSSSFSKAEGGRHKILRSTDAGLTQELSNVAEIILTLNRDDNDVIDQRLKILLEKNRDGEKMKIYGLETDLAYSKINTGRYFDASNLISSVSMEDFEENSVSKVSDDNEEVRKSLLKVIGSHRKVDMDITELMKVEEEARFSNDTEKVDSIRSQVQALKDAQTERVKKVKELVSILYGTPTRDLYENMKMSLRDMEKDNPDRRIEIEKAKAEVTYLKYYFEH